MDGKGLSQNAGLGGQTYGGSKLSKLRLRCLTAGWSGELYVWTNPWWGSFHPDTFLFRYETRWQNILDDLTVIHTHLHVHALFQMCRVEPSVLQPG